MTLTPDLVLSLPKLGVVHNPPPPPQPRTPVNPSPRKFFNLESLKCHFPGLWGEILQNSDSQFVTIINYLRPWSMSLHQSPRRGLPLGPLGLGPPGFACSESIVVITPEDSTCQGESHVPISTCPT